MEVDSSYGLQNKSAAIALLWACTEKNEFWSHNMDPLNEVGWFLKISWPKTDRISSPIVILIATSWSTKKSKIV